MSVQKPASYVNWSCSNGSMQQPPPSLCLTGWTYLMAPPMEYMNFITHTLDQWVQWLDQVTTPTTQMFPLTTNGTIANTAGFDSTYWCAPATSAGLTFTMPLSTNYPGYIIRIKNTLPVTTNWLVSVVVTGSDKIENATSDVLGAGEYRAYKSDGLGNWWIVGQN